MKRFVGFNESRLNESWSQGLKDSRTQGLKESRNQNIHRNVYLLIRSILVLAPRPRGSTS
ncbi:hypothetical protein K501DRAFT_286163 [Backusella circina FSU 941]|nr:hypothetical protein K501DRAFT_286163 [Backusella circina FSU 941]